MNAKKLIKQPTIKNLTEYAVNNADRFIANSVKFPTVFWCVGDRDVKAVELSNESNATTPDTAMNLFADYCGQICIAEAAKANMMLMDSHLATRDQAPNQTASLLVEIPGLQVYYLFSIVQDKTGKSKLGKLLQAPAVVHVNQFDQLIPIGIPSPTERLQASMMAYSGLQPCPSVN